MSVCGKRKVNELEVKSEQEVVADKQKQTKKQKHKKPTSTNKNIKDLTKQKNDEISSSY